jgi:hypothetical protein
MFQSLAASGSKKTSIIAGAPGDDNNSVAHGGYSVELTGFNVDDRSVGRCDAHTASSASRDREVSRRHGYCGKD